MSANLLIWLLVIATLISLWMHHSRFNRRATAAAHAYLRQQGLQFLDQSAVLTRLRPARGGALGICLARTYRFEFAARGDRRYFGWIRLNGYRVTGVELQAYAEAAAPPPVDPPVHH